MKYLPSLTGGLLGFIFITFGLNFWLKFIPIPQSPEESPSAMFFAGMFLSGFLAFVKLLEIAGGVLVAIPATRRLGLLTLGPIVVCIAAYSLLFKGFGGLFSPPTLAVIILSAALLYFERQAFLKFIKG
ncbi:MAG: hypothetical protein EAZ42_04105 [Verrucomicrobia bacterium]|nr:MAG: hypothetical protein EAZ42_04105 [Verrucomicrobiota bacterium]